MISKDKQQIMRSTHYYTGLQFRVSESIESYYQDNELFHIIMTWDYAYYWSRKVRASKGIEFDYKSNIILYISESKFA